jgi:hypothetical protein
MSRTIFSRYAHQPHCRVSLAHTATLAALAWGLALAFSVPSAAAREVRRPPSSIVCPSPLAALPGSVAPKPLPQPPPTPYTNSPAGETFLATLATTIGTLLAILLAAITAYFVFLQERSTEYSDRIFFELLAIREQMLPLRKILYPPDFVPSAFITRYRAKYPTLTGAGLINQLASQLFTFGGTHIEKEFAEIDDRHRGKPWRGRLYHFLLKQAVYVIAPHFEPWKPRRGTFPSAPVEIGFAEWRAQFDTMDRFGGVAEWQGGFFSDALRIRDTMVDDFSKFSGLTIQVSSKATPAAPRPGPAAAAPPPSGPPPKPSASPPPQPAYRSVENFFTTIEAIRASLNRIDKLENAIAKYRRSKLHTRSLATSCSLAFVFGVLVPLVMLIGDHPLIPWQAGALMFVALGATLLSFFRFGRDVFQSGKLATTSERRSYLSLHWYQPLLDQMKVQEKEKKFARRGPVDLDLFDDAARSGDLGGDLLSRLTRYIGATREYNARVNAFDAYVLELFRRDATLGPIVSQQHPPGGGGFGFSPYDMLKRETIVETLQKLYARLEAQGRSLPPSGWPGAGVVNLTVGTGLGLSVSTFGLKGGPTGPSHFRIPVAMLGEQQLLSALISIHDTLADSTITHAIELGHQEVELAGAALTQELNALVGDTTST